MLGQAYAEHVYWMENEPGRQARVSLHAAPLDVAPLLHELLFSRVSSAVLTSATLAAADDDGFGYLLGRLGVAEAETLRLGSPFDFRASGHAARRNRAARPVRRRGVCDGGDARRRVLPATDAKAGRSSCSPATRC